MPLTFRKKIYFILHKLFQSKEKEWNFFSIFSEASITKTQKANTKSARK
jgi:hypothetical protein